jgi:PAS domain S-box-containing protein
VNKAAASPIKAYRAAPSHPSEAFPSELLERHAALLDAISDAVIMVAPSGEILYANLRAAELLCYHPGELHGRSVHELLPPALRSGHAQHLAEYFRSPNRRPMGQGQELAAWTGDGAELRVEVSLSPFSLGSAVVCLALMKDITKASEYQELLRLRSAALEAAANGICMTNLDGEIIWINRAFTELTGYGTEEALGANPRILKSARQDASVYRDLWETIGSGQVWRGELINRRRDDSEYIEEQTITPVRNRDGAITHFIAVKTDVSERRQAEDKARLATNELKRRTKELARSNEDLAQFAYAASHDLQEPLRMVSGFLQLLKKRYAAQLNDEAQEFIGFAVDGATRMKQLIDGLLEFSRVRTRGKEPTLVELTDVMKSTLSLLAGMIQESGAQVEYDALPCVRGDSSQLIQLFQNLIGNALKFRGERPPRIHVYSTPIPGGWHLCVADNGIGIETQHQERIFEVFQRLHDRRRYEGTGMGLALCKRIVERHHGAIWVESEPGQGASFHFTLYHNVSCGEASTPP